MHSFCLYSKRWILLRVIVLTISRFLGPPPPLIFIFRLDMPLFKTLLCPFGKGAKCLKTDKIWKSVYTWASVYTWTSVFIICLQQQQYNSLVSTDQFSWLKDQFFKWFENRVTLIERKPELHKNSENQKMPQKMWKSSGTCFKITLHSAIEVADIRFYIFWLQDFAKIHYRYSHQMCLIK